MRVRSHAALAALAVVCLAIGAACGGSTGGGEVSAVTPAELDQGYLAQVADTTSAARTGRFEYRTDTRTTFNGHTTSARTTVTASFDDDRDLVQQHLTASLEGMAGDPSPVDVEIVGTATDWYARGSLFAEDGVAPGQWLEIPKQATAGRGTEPFRGPIDPGKALDHLRGVGATIDDRGTVEIDGVTTRHVHATASMSDIGAGVFGEPSTPSTNPTATQVTLDGPTELDVYIDGDNRVRRLTMSSTISTPSLPHGPGAPDGEISTTTTMDFADYGKPVTIAVPADDETIDGVPYLDRRSSTNAVSGSGSGSVDAAGTTTP